MEQNRDLLAGRAASNYIGRIWYGIGGSYTCLYLTAIILANLSVAYFGPRMTIVNAFLFIGLDLTSRDALHERWHKQGLYWKMGLLILTGSILSWALNSGAGRIALASFVAFMCAGIADTLIYQLLYKRPRFQKINSSNIVSAAVDSIVFPTLAFGVFLPWIILGQFIAKVGGGLAWSLVLRLR